MKIAICQMKIAFENKIENLKKIEKFVIEAKGKGADIVFFPEMSLTGFSMNILKTRESDFSNVDRIKKIAFQNEIFIGFGWVEDAGEKAKNCYSIINGQGDEICKYVKIHPFSYSGENKYFYGGNNIAVFNVDKIKFGIFICYDLRFPEIFQAVSKEASVIVVAANWPRERREHWKGLLKARAIENQTYVIGVNCFGEQNEIYYSGDSCGFNPNGDEIYFIGENEELLIFEIFDDVFEYRKKFPLKNDRREDLYKKFL